MHPADKELRSVPAHVARRLLGVWAIALALLAAVPAQADVRDAASALSAEKARYAAMVAADVPALDRILADEAMYYHTTGWGQTKAEHIGHIGSRTAVYRKIEILESRQRVFGDVAIVEGVTQFTAGPTSPISYKLSFITVFVWRDRRWQMLTFHCAKIPVEGALPPGNAPGTPPPGTPPPGSPPAGGAPPRK